ncbi:MAG: NAD(P)/FAD-dependent oxidoreductase [Candidatus Sericytochromatia bacterium]|nr:NAD(P)/FAD-dependent oxidoreductase [Candidatus Sericytochromatia bacterium]
MNPDVIIVGAGMAGLACAVTLQAAGKQVCLLEGSSRVGGRVGSLLLPAGHRIDLGFQVLFSAYPTLNRLVDVRALDWRAYEAGALIRTGSAWRPVADPFRQPGDLWSTVTSGLYGPTDAWALMRLGLETARSEGDPPLGRSTAEDWNRLGFSERFQARFLRPFFSGIWLDRTLDVDAAVFRFYWRMLASGQAVVPAQGMQALPDQLAGRLTPGSLWTNTPVQALRREQGRVVGVALADGRVLEAPQVVLATPAPELSRLLEDPTRRLRGKPAVTMYFAAPEAPFQRRLIALAPDATGPVGIVAVPSLVAPDMSPAGEHQVAVQLLPDAAGRFDSEPEAVLKALRQWFPAADLSAWRWLHTVTVPFAQFDQGVGTPRWPERHPSGCLLASEATRQSSIEGALRSGVQAAEAILGAS